MLHAASPADTTQRPPALLSRPLVLWAVVLGGWLLLSLLLAPEVYLYSLYMGAPIPWRDTLTLTTTNAAIAAAFTPLIVWLTKRFPLARGAWGRGLLVHVPACVVFSVTHAWLYNALCYAWHPTFQWLFARFHPNLLTYWAVVGLTEAMMYFQRFQARERELAHAQLQLLRNQLHPHFLFNTLHTISAMMHEDVQAADRMVSCLSDLLRLTLDHIGQHEVPLREEIAFVNRYLEIEQARFQNQLTFTVDVPPDTFDAVVPSMLLQPLVENCIRHGFGGRARSGCITVRAWSRNGRLVVAIADNGRGLPDVARGPARGGLGLANLRRRLEQLYPGVHRFALENAPGGGTVATIELPLRVQPVQEPLGVS